jgi:agmatinase
MSEQHHGSAAPGEGIFGLDDTPEDARVVLLAVPWEATTSYGRGTAKGPAAILAASVQVDLFDVELGEPYRAGIAMIDPSAELSARAAEAARSAERVIAAFAAGRPVAHEDSDRARVNELSAWLDEHLARAVGDQLGRGKIVGTVGGDHSVAFGPIAAHVARHPGIGILHIDAHADLRVAYQGFVGSHASIMHNVMSRLDGVARLVSVGLRDLCREEHEAIAASEGRIVAHYDAALARARHEGRSWRAICDDIVSDLPATIYVSFDIDGLDPVLCPATGTPVPGGLGFLEAMTLLSAVVDSGRRIVGFDLCEVAPGATEWDANVGARVLYKLIGYALAKAA